MINTRLFVKALATASALLLLSACKAGYESADSNLNSDAPTYIGITSSSKWVLTMQDEETETETDNDFRLRKYNNIDGELEITLTGTYDKLNTGFTQLNIDTATGTDDLDENDRLTALVAAENYAVFIEPFETDALQVAQTQVIALLPEAECPSANFTKGAITIRTPSGYDATNASQPYYGELTHQSTEKNAILDKRRSLTQVPVDGNETFTGAECAEGIAFNSTNAHVFGANNTAIIHQDREDTANDRILIALSSDDLASASQLNESYVGFMYDPTATTSSQNFVTVATTCSEGVCAIRKQTDINNINNSAPTTYTVTLEMPNADFANGFIEGTIEDHTDETPNTSNIACNAHSDVKDSNGKFLICVAQAPTSTTQSLNLFLISN